MNTMKRCSNRPLRLLSTGVQGAHRSLPVAVSFDIDGVLLRGNQRLPGAREGLLELQRRAIPYVFLTNGGGELEWKKAAKLSEILELQVSADQVILSHTPLRPILQKYAAKRVLVLGCRDVKEVASSYCSTAKVVDIPALAHDDPLRYPFIHSDFVAAPNRDEPIEAVFVLHDPNSWAREIQITMDVLRGGNPLGSGGNVQRIPLYASNPDLVFAGLYPVPRLAAGAFLVALGSLWRQVTGTELRVEQYGKPSAATFSYASDLLHSLALSPEFGRWDSSQSLRGQPSQECIIHRILHVGDNPKADVRGANLAGFPWQSILVRTGVFRGGANDDTDPAKYVVDGVGDAVAIALAHAQGS